MEDCDICGADSGAQQVLDDNRKHQLENLSVKTGAVREKFPVHIKYPPPYKKHS